MKYLITGGCGFLGSNLASEVLKRGDELVVFDNLYRNGAEKNLEWLKSLGDFTFYRADVRNNNDVEFVFEKERPDVIFHVAGQVAMTTSLERPGFDFEINVMGTFNVLQSIRKYVPKSIVIYSSTNKVYGDLEEFNYQETDSRYVMTDFPNGLPESTRLDFRTPYGCSKGAADQYMLDFHRRYGVNSVVFRHSSIFGGRQFATFDQGWIGWFVDRALHIEAGTLKESFTVSGNGKQVRDVLFSKDIISCYFQAAEHIDKTAGEVFNIGGGTGNSLSILELFSILEEELNIKMNYTELPVRASDQQSFIADISKAEKLFNWKPSIGKIEGLREMISWVRTL